MKAFGVDSKVDALAIFGYAGSYWFPRETNIGGSQRGQPHQRFLHQGALGFGLLAR